MHETLAPERPLRAARRHDGVEVLHVTEALGAGVGRSLARLVRLQTEAGARCVVLATRRYDTPDDPELLRWFGPDVELIIAPSSSSRRQQLVWLARSMRGLLRGQRFSAIHLHSSFAGAVGRMVAFPSRRRTRVFYSPHGFAFLRSDLAPVKRHAILLVESLLAAVCGVLVLVSPTELEVARSRVGKRVELLMNGVDLRACRPVDSAVSRERPVVAMVGRIAYQKAPWRFAEAARRFEGLADFHWLGYGEEEDQRRWLDGAPIAVSGPLPHDELLRRLGATDVLFFPTLWEGMPLSVIEAQACGVPVVASDIDGNRDIVVDGRTGYLRAGEDDMFEALERLVRDGSLRERFAAEAAAAATRRFSDERRGAESLLIYSRGTTDG